MNNNSDIVEDETTIEDDTLEDSILDNIKKMLGIASENTDFDTDIIIHINSVFSTLHQLGIGPSNGYAINGKDSTWEDYITTSQIENVRSYIYLRVRLLFDPPQNSFLVDSFKEQIKELEWRFTVTSDEIQNGGESDGTE